MTQATEEHPVSTIDPDRAAGVDWDAVVVGAGLAGSIAARGLARSGRRVLLVERTAFPRPKVCGCCLGPLGRATLESVDLGHVLDACRARPLESVQLHVGRRPAHVPLRGVVGVSREALDQHLAREAVASGTELLLEARAEPRPDGTVGLQVDGRRFELAARTVLHAGGLRAHESEGPGHGEDVMVGFGALVPTPGRLRGADRVEMVLDRDGYVGVAPLDDGRMTVASALRTEAIKRTGGPRAVVKRLLHGAGLGELVDETTRFTGVPALRRRRTLVQEDRLLAIGDAASFVEPITGEGMSWALASGAAVVPCAEAVIAHGPGVDHWTTAWRRLMRRRHLRCSIVGSCIRRPALVRAALAVSSILPVMRAPILSGLLGGRESMPEGEPA